MNKAEVQSVEGWLALPEITLPTLRSPSETGSRYKVYKAGFLAANEVDSTKAGIQAQKVPGGKVLLPTITIDSSGERQLCRLPTDLADWVMSCMSSAMAGLKPFPAQVEFGYLDGRSYAEFL